MDNGADYYYDAIRTPWRVALDASWNCAPSGIEWTGRMAAFFEQKGPDGIGQGFKMDGTSLGGDKSLCMVATAATAMVPGQPQSTVNKWWTEADSTTTGGGLYFCDSLRMLALTFMAGLMHRPEIAI